MGNKQKNGWLSVLVKEVIGSEGDTHDEVILQETAAKDTREWEQNSGTVTGGDTLCSCGSSSAPPQF